MATPTFLWNDIPWLGWNVILIGSLASLTFASEPPNPWFILARIGLATLAHKFLPNGHFSVFPYSGHLALAGLIPYSYRLGGVWTFFTVFVVFGILPLADFIVGRDSFNHEKVDEISLSRKAAFKFATFLVVPLQLGLICWGCHAVAVRPPTLLELIGLSCSVGVYTGGIGITVSHELSHKASKLEQLLGRLLVVSVAYGHFYIEHLYGHHKDVACPTDPASARCGESFYAFLPRVLKGEFRSACAIEAERVKSKGLPWWANEMYWYSTSSALLLMVLVFLFGRMAIPVFCLQACFAILLFELVNYLEHYGLERALLPNGEYESVQYRHSWDSSHRLTNFLLFKLQRHADHHVNGGKWYQCLKVYDSSPQLPSGYPGCIVLALIPPLWRAVMHPRLMEHRRLVTKETGQKWTFGPQP